MAQRRSTPTMAMLGAAAVLGACLPAFAPPIRAERQHRGLSSAAADTTCFGCHATQRAAQTEVPHGGAPVVATWMVNDRRGCVGCHTVRDPRR